jgi:hypothetical protein
LGYTLHKKLAFGVVLIKGGAVSGSAEVPEGKQ